MRRGRLEPFCVALSQIALKYADQEEKRSQRLRLVMGGRLGSEVHSLSSRHMLRRYCPPPRATPP